jgi:HEAT repeat protein/beta-lactamase regulating signal transducer with metallopeptidase domain
MSETMMSLVVGSAVKSTVILGLAATGAIWLRRGSAASRHLAWQLGLVGVLVLPVVMRLSPLQYEIPLPFTFARPAAPADNVEPADPQAGANVSFDVNQRAAEHKASDATANTVPNVAGSSVESPSNASAPARNWLRWLVTIWVVGVVAVLGRFALGLLLARWYTRRAKPLDAVEWASLNETMSFAVGLGHPVRLLKSARAATPMTYGVLNPVVLLPRDADEWPEERRRIVLLHELAHVHRLDSLTHIFANLACAVYWFNPLVWITAARLRAEAERACDDWVLRAGMRASTYADHLLDMVRTIGRLHTPVAALPMAQRSTFEGRLLAILEPGINRSGLTRGQAVLLTSIIALVVFPLAALAPAAGSKNDLNVPVGIVNVVDTTKHKSKSKVEHYEVSGGQVREQQQQATVRKEKGWLTETVSNALELVLGKGEAARQAKAAIKDADIEASIDKALKDADISGTVHDALKGVTGHAQQSQQLSDRALNGLINALRDTDVEVRAQAAHVLGDQEDERAIAALSRALREDSDAGVRKAAAWALGNIGDARGVPALTDAMRDSSREVRAMSVWALGEIEDARAVPALAEAVRDSDLEIRRQAVWALGQIEDRAAIPALTVALRDQSPEVREMAVWALAEIEDPQAVAPLASMLGDGSAAVRKQVAWALGQIESSNAVAPLSRLLREDNDAGVRETAAWALGEIEDEAAIPALGAALKDASVGVRRQAAWALGQIEHRPAPPQLLEAVNDSDVEVRRTAIWALAKIEDPNSTSALRAALRDRDTNVKYSALRGLMAIGDSAAYEVLLEMMKDPDPAVRRMATQAIGGGRFNWPDPRPQPRLQPRPQPRPHPNG